MACLFLALAWICAGVCALSILMMAIIWLFTLAAPINSEDRDFAP